jgi:hypothetical protein
MWKVAKWIRVALKKINQEDFSEHFPTDGQRQVS